MKNSLTPTDEDVEDILRRKEVDKKRVEEQKQFYEIARTRAAELDTYMEQYVCRDRVWALLTTPGSVKTL